jgi:hypothetical protein
MVDHVDAPMSGVEREVPLAGAEQHVTEADVVERARDARLVHRGEVGIVRVLPRPSHPIRT